jgi:AcrR family transcriptional regulator
MVHLVKVRSDAVRNRARILDVARDLIGRAGPGVSMDDIAGEAGVAVGTLYRHFPTKAALVEAIVHDSIAQIADAADAASERIAGGASAGDELADLFRLVADRHSTDAAVKEAATSLGAKPFGADGVITDFEPGSPEMRAWMSIARLLDAAVTEGSIRPDLTAADLLALVSGVPREPVSAEVRNRYVEIVLAGVRPTGR